MIFKKGHKKILIFGGSGYIGSAVANYFINFGQEVNFPKTNEVNLLNHKEILNYINKKRPTLVISVVGKPMNSSAPDLELRRIVNKNLEAEFNLIDCARKIGVAEFMNISSASILYNKKNIKENLVISELTKPIEPYGAAKFTIAKLIEETGLEGNNWRNLIIPRIIGFYRDVLNPYSYIFATMVEKIRLNPEMTFSKNFLELDGEYVHVLDICKFLLDFITNMELFNFKSAINILFSNEISYKNADLLEYMKSAIKINNLLEIKELKINSHKALVRNNWKKDLLNFSFIDLATSFYILKNKIKVNDYFKNYSNGLF